MNEEYGYTPQPGADPQPGYQPPQPGYQPPQPGYQQPGYGQQPPQYAPPTGYYPPSQGKTGKGSGWIALLRVILWIQFGLICLFGLLAFIGFSALPASEGGAAAGIMCLVGSVLFAFLSVAIGMVLLDAAKNISRCATNSARIVDLLEQNKGK